MRFRLLGSLRVETENGELDLGQPKQRSVLAVLLLHANEVVSTDRIIELVWGDRPPRTAEHSVQIYVSELRKALSNGSPSELIETRPPGYVLNVPPDSVDTLRFEHLIRDGLTAIRTGDFAAGRPKLEGALELWTSPPLSDFAYEDFAQGYVRSLEELRSDALEALARLELDQGVVDEARRLARLAIEADALRDEPRRIMMMALYRSGRQAEALRHYGEYQALLGEELGIEPSDSIKELEERILFQDPTLNLQSSVETEGNPYKGLRAFSEDDAEVYFGREALVAEVRERLTTGSGFVSIVGPSGSGKSSAAQAGLIPGLRADGETVVLFQPGSRPLWELAGALDRAGFGTRASLLRRFEGDPSSLSSVVTRPLVLIVDQFEELFTLGEPDIAVRFSELIALAIHSPSTPLRVVATLRADYYDRPLSIPALAGVFSESVVNVKPMSPRELESAVVEPARAAGVSVEPGLLAQIVSDMGHEPGSLPLLQFTLFELFERTSNGLTLRDYESLGGLQGALTGGADELLEELDANARDLAEQLMMRMVQKGRALSTARPVALRELLELGVDRVVLQDVLEAFGTRRLITFDRDASGAAVVEMAHEYLISEWPQMDLWITEHGEDLDRLYDLDTAAKGWIDAAKSEDYLLRGARLEEFERWAASTTLRLTATEKQFIGASVEVRDREQRQRDEQVAKEEQLKGRARRRLWYFGGAVAALAATLTVLIMTLIPEPPPDIVVWYNGRGDGSFGDLIGAGVDRAKAANPDLVIAERFEPSPQFETIQELIDTGVKLVIWDQQRLESWDPAPFIEDHPDTHFVFLDCTVDGAPLDPAPANTSCVTAQNHEIGFLAGVAAALATDTGRVGFLGGFDFPVIWGFQAGFEQGVEFMGENVEVDIVYLTSDGDFSGFSSWTLGDAATRYLGARGSDVIFHAAGWSGWGMFNRAAGEELPVWAIGVDVDQYEEVAAIPGLQGRADDIRSVILTSAVKRIDIGVDEVISQFLQSGEVGDVFVTIGNGGVDYTTSGGHMDAYESEMEAAIEAIRSGDVVIDPWARSGTTLLLDRLLDGLDARP